MATFNSTAGCNCEFTVNTCIFQGRVKRRKKLREKWFFDCFCRRCKDPTELGSHVSTLKCTNDSCSGLIISKSSEANDQTCAKCGLVMTCDEIDDAENE